MIELRTHCTRATLATLANLATLAALLVGAGGDASASPLGKLQAELERGLRHAGRNLEAPRAAQAQGRFMSAEWHPGPAIGRLTQPQLIRVATATDGQPKAARHEKELKETKQKLEILQQEHEALTKKYEESESACAQVTKQVETLTWANEVLVKELDAAYATRGSEKPGLLPEGTRGIYVLRKGESLSRVAKAFYGDSKRWRDLVEANKDKIPDPNMVKAGTVILIPE